MLPRSCHYRIIRISSWLLSVGLFFCVAISQAQVQVGEDIVGPDGFGWSIALSSDGKRLAIGAPFSSDEGDNSGAVRVFDWDGENWIAVGIPLHGAAGDNFGHALGMSGDGSRLVVGAPRATGGGYARTFSWNGSAWTQQGTDIKSNAAFDNTAYAVDISDDGNRIAVTAEKIDTPCSACGGTSIALYDWQEVDWALAGDPIYVEFPDSGYGPEPYKAAIALAGLGNRIVIGYGHPVCGLCGFVSVFDWSGVAWTQTGKNIQGQSGGFGNEVAISADGSTIATVADGGQIIKLFRFQENGWFEIGQLNALTGFGGYLNKPNAFSSFALSEDGNRIVVSAARNYSVAYRDGDQVTQMMLTTTVFDFDGEDWLRDIDATLRIGPLDCCASPTVVMSPDGNSIGLSLNHSNNTDLGLARVYSLNDLNISRCTLETENAYSVGGSLVNYIPSNSELSVWVQLGLNHPADSGVAEILPQTWDDYSNDEFTFTKKLPAGECFSVEILNQPRVFTVEDLRQTCSVNNGRGVIGTSDINGVEVLCEKLLFNVKADVSGLEGTGLVLSNTILTGGSGNENLAIFDNGLHQFVKGVPDGACLDIDVFSQPTQPRQLCSVVSTAGLCISGGSDLQVGIVCETETYSVGGEVSGLGSTGVLLQLNDGETVGVSSDRPFSFDTKLPDGSFYNVIILVQPSDQSRNCTIRNGTGVLDGANIIDIEVECAVGSFAVGGEVTGLKGTGLVLQNNSGDNLEIFSEGSFSFPTAMTDSSQYNVSVFSSPGNPSQECSVFFGSGIVNGDNINNVLVTCDTIGYSIGGNVAGLGGAGLTLANNGEVLPVKSNGGFTFNNTQNDGTIYGVDILIQPEQPSQTCNLANGVGTIASADITNVEVSCETDTFTIGGTVTGLEGEGLVIRNNGSDSLPIEADGRFNFPTLLPDSNTFEVTIWSQPSTVQDEVCRVTYGNGVLNGANVNDVDIRCKVVIYENGFE